MKKLTTLKYTFFSLIVFGCFANFAQNEYGMLIVKACLAALAILFFVEAVKGKISLKSTFLFMESLFIALFISGWVFKMQHWPGAGPILIISGAGISILYIKRGLSELKLGWKNDFKTGLLTCMSFIAVSLGFMGWVFSVQHWLGANAMFMVTVFLLPIIGLLSLIKYKSQDESIRFIQYIGKFKGNIFLLQVVFTVIVVYLGLRELEISPSFYSLENPPTLNELRLKKEQGGKKEEAVYRKYRDDYEKFTSQRIEAEDLDR